jgi:DNA-binding IscR family transcriptional regulator
MDGPIALKVCVASGDSCDRHAECPAHQVWLQAQSAMLSVLREAKIAEMIPIKESSGGMLKNAECIGAGQHCAPNGAARFTRNKKL